MVARRHQVPAQPVHEWIRNDVVPDYGSLLHLCEILASKTYIQPKSWHRWFTRLARRELIDIWTVDRLCTLLGAHVSRFDHIYWIPTELLDEVI